MLKVKQDRIKELINFNFVEKTHFYYNVIRVNKHNGIIELGNYKYSPYENLGKTRYNVPNVLLDLFNVNMLEYDENCL